MNEIKNSLLLLSKEIRNLCNVDIKSEHLRLAKFNQVGENNVETLWQVLRSFCRQASEGFTEQYGDVMFVKCCLASLGYTRIDFYKLPPSKNTGSRELLIAIAWLIAKEDILDALIRKKILDFNRQIYICHTGREPKEEDTRNWKESFSFDDSLNYTLFLCTKLKNCVKNMYDYSEELIKLSDKDTVLENAEVNSCSSISHVGDDVMPVTELVQVLLAAFNCKIRSAEETKNTSFNAGHFPRFIFQSSRNQNKHSDLSFLQKSVESKLTSHKESVKKLEMELYSALKNIAETKLGPVLFVIPQMYAK